ncbi:MAG: SoxS protein [Paracoccus sp. (in: a-proteobacteria)]|uniref:SoxS protein n=1 Tax=Paracoccus sp. TaxID=267 RepID=UPI0039E61483
MDWGRRIFLGALAWALAGPAVAGGGALRLMMVRRKGCVYCAEWDREIGPIYARQAEGRAAPLFMVDVDGPYPDGLALDRMPWLTPSFILLRDGIEIARFEGYPGAGKFFPLLRDMLKQAAGPG